MEPLVLLQDLSLPAGPRPAVAGESYTISASSYALISAASSRTTERSNDRQKLHRSASTHQHASNGPSRLVLPQVLVKS